MHKISILVLQNISFLNYREWRNNEKENED